MINVTKYIYIKFIRTHMYYLINYNIQILIVRDVCFFGSHVIYFIHLIYDAYRMNMHNHFRNHIFAVGFRSAFTLRNYPILIS